MSGDGIPNAAAQLQALLREHSFTPEQIAETALHALYPALSEGAANTYHRLGRGAVLMDLRNLEAGELNTTYVPQNMLLRLNEEAELFGEALSAVGAYDPEREFVSIVWLPTVITIFRLALL